MTVLDLGRYQTHAPILEFILKAIFRYDQFAHPPKMYINIHGAPHERQHRAVLQKYREDLTASFQRQMRDVSIPIDHPIDLEVFFTNPASPDLNHVLTALYCALDEKSLKGPAILKDDRHIQKVTMSKYYAGKATKRDGQR